MGILAYLIGSFPTGVLVGKTFYHKDIRDYGSGNTGTTNTYRVLGFVPGTIVLVIDILKGTLAGLLPVLFYQNTHFFVLLFGVIAVIGHCFSIFLHFKGGKAVATSAGIALAYDWHFFLMSAVIFAIILLLTSTVSLTSIISFPLITLEAVLFNDWLLASIAALITVFIIYRHKDNIKRFMNGTEEPMHFGLRYYILKKKSHK
ncbi:glycerol-3-phosphate 1-O-acyltransferase PlsY [Holzapfeliella sp. He02]|uniref:Glycerol-3-phosphate acyltransferase n=1 Tax=Holzapfeliella saturejae TaxID=3082953 RepID=A0ABU8SGP4_9LACO